VEERDSLKAYSGSSGEDADLEDPLRLGHEGEVLENRRFVRTGALRAEEGMVSRCYRTELRESDALDGWEGRTGAGGGDRAQYKGSECEKVVRKINLDDEVTG
jgi:hypothetical protein